MRNLLIVIGQTAALILFVLLSLAGQAQFGTEQEARAMQEKAVVALKENQAQALEKFEVSYWWPRPGSEKPLEKHTFYTKIADQNCGVGFYKE